MVPFKGDASEVLYQLVGGLKSGMGYTGSKDINNLKANTKFVKISNAASIEGHPPQYKYYQGSSKLFEELIFAIINICFFLIFYRIIKL